MRKLLFVMSMVVVGGASTFLVGWVFVESLESTRKSEADKAEWLERTKGRVLVKSCMNGINVFRLRNGELWTGGGYFAAEYRVDNPETVCGK